MSNNLDVSIYTNTERRLRPLLGDRVIAIRDIEFEAPVSKVPAGSTGQVRAVKHDGTAVLVKWEGIANVRSANTWDVAFVRRGQLTRLT